MEGEESEDHLLRPSDHTLFNASKGPVGLFGHKGAPLAHGQLNTQFPLCKASPGQVSP